MSPDALTDELLGSLALYAQRYGLPETPEQVEGVVGSLLQIKAQTETLGLTPPKANRVIRRVMAALNPEALATEMTDQAHQALVEQTYQWRQQLESEIKDTLNAYVQSYAPGMTVNQIHEVITTAMPLIKKGSATKAEVTGLVSQMAETFDLEEALSARINPIYVGMAKNLAIALSQKPMESAVTETVTAYVEKFAPALETIGEDLIENALSAVLKNKVEFGLDTDLNLADRQLLINQISFKLNIMEQSPPPSKTAQQIAAELETAIDRFKEQRESQLGSVEVTPEPDRPDGLTGMSAWTSSHRSQPPDSNSEPDPGPDHPAAES